MLTTTVSLGEGPAREPVEGDDAQELVAVDDVAALVDGHAAVGIAVEAEAHVPALLGEDGARAAGAVAPQSRLMLMPSGTSKWVVTLAPLAARMAGATWLAEPFAQSRWTSQRGTDTAGQAEPMLEVAVEVAASVDDAAEAGVRRAVQLVGAQDERRELVLERVVELLALACEDLEPVVVGRIVRGRDHDARGVAGRGRDVGQRRRRTDTQDMDVRSGRRDARHEGGHEHVPGATRVLAHDDAAAWARQARRDGAAEVVGESRLAGPRWRRRGCRRCRRGRSCGRVRR